MVWLFGGRWGKEKNLGIHLMRKKALGSPGLSTESWQPCRTLVLLD